MERKISFLPERFREAVASANMTQRELARRVGVSVSSIRRYMSGAPIVQRRVRVAIARVLNVNTGWLIGREDSPERKPGQLHLDELCYVMSALRKNEHMLNAVATLCECEEITEIARELGVPDDFEPIEVRQEIAQRPNNLDDPCTGAHVCCNTSKL